MGAVVEGALEVVTNVPSSLPVTGTGVFKVRRKETVNRSQVRTSTLCEPANATNATCLGVSR